VSDPLLSKIQPKSLEEIIAAARETIHRHRRRFLQRNLRPCPQNCKGVSTLGREIVGCTNCGSPSGDRCIKEDKFVPVYTKEELAQQFAEQLRNPEILLREYRDVTVFLWVLGAFDKQKKTLDEKIVERVEQSEDKVRKMAANSGGSPSVHGVRERHAGANDPESAPRTGEPVQNHDPDPEA
jgi:hypothetical protein